jgi:Ca2+-binding RTX toxin-like protein
MGTVLTHDNITAGKHEDWLFPDPGNDRVNGNAGADFIAGGSGDDLILGDAHGDILYGDGFYAPVVEQTDLLGQVFVWSLPTEPDPTVVDGNDQMLGGPRGQGWTDVLTGGGGNDAFYLSYTDTDSASGGTGF